MRPRVCACVRACVRVCTPGVSDDFIYDVTIKRIICGDMCVCVYARSRVRACVCEQVCMSKCASASVSL